MAQENYLSESDVFGEGSQKRSLKNSCFLNKLEA